MKKKVLYVVTKANWGGAQRYVYDLAVALKDMYDVSVAFGAPGRLEFELHAHGIRTKAIQSLQRDISFSTDVKAFFELIKIIKQEAPEVVHLNSSKAGGIGALAARVAGVPNIVFTVHGTPWDEDRNFFWRLFAYIGSKLTFILCHKVITITSDNHKRVPGSTLIHNGIRPIYFYSKDEAREKLMLPSNAFVIGGLGELTWNKGFHHLMRAAGEIKRKQMPFLLVIAGDGEDKDFLKTMIAEEGLNGSVMMVGFLEEGARYLKAFDVFALPSVKEGLPYVLLEAGLAGVPVVASDLPGCKDIVDDRETGLLFESKNASDLARKIELLASEPDLKTDIGEALKEKVSREFSLDQMVKKTSALY